MEAAGATIRPLLAAGIIACGPVLGATGEEAYSENDAPCVEDEAALMAMDYWTFDQAPEGVRSVAAKPGCRLAAADLMRDYHAALRESGKPVTTVIDGQPVVWSPDGEMEMLYWHEGQLRAFEGQTEAAARLFRKSVKPEAESHLGWNEYVSASVAFLEGDREALLRAREALAAEIRPGHELNLRVVDGLVACFERSYLDAYGAEECNRREGLSGERD